jgi:transcriptional regulator GlxA family with amidase domain
MPKGGDNMSTRLVRLAKQEFLDQFREWEQSVSEDDRLHRLLKFERNLESLTLDNAAEAAALERCSFSRYFHNIVGVRFRDWRTALRVATAIQLLANTTDDVETVALSIGYQDGRSLRRAMQRFVGASPTSFRSPTYFRGQVEESARLRK